MPEFLRHPLLGVGFAAFLAYMGWMGATLKSLDTNVAVLSNTVVLLHRYDADPNDFQNQNSHYVPSSLELAKQD